MKMVDARREKKCVVYHLSFLSFSTYHYLPKNILRNQVILRLNELYRTKTNILLTQYQIIAIFIHSVFNHDSLFLCFRYLWTDISYITAVLQSWMWRLPFVRCVFHTGKLKGRVLIHFHSVRHSYGCVIVQNKYWWQHVWALKEDVQLTGSIPCSIPSHSDWVSQNALKTS